MKHGLIALGAMTAIATGILTCPQSLRDQVSEHASLPPHVYEEAERQLTLFVSWARDEGSRPDTRDYSGLAP